LAVRAVTRSRGRSTPTARDPSVSSWSHSLAPPSAPLHGRLAPHRRGRRRRRRPLSSLLAAPPLGPHNRSC
jgi:hypothetical protein